MQQENEVVNAGIDVATAPTTNTDRISNNPDDEKRYSKNDVIGLMKKRVERSHNSFFNRYGVKDLDGLDALFDKSNKFDSMNNEFGSLQMKFSELSKENAFLRNNINPDRYGDVNNHFKGQGIDFNEEELVKALATHPEWLKIDKPKTTFKTLGSESHSTPVETDEQKMNRVFGLK